MAAQRQAQAALETNVATAFDVLGWEIELAGARCIFLDTLIGELMPTIPLEKRARLMEGMHAVDLLAQHLTSLSAFAHRISAETPELVGIPVGAALDEITLGALADRMFASFGGEDDMVDGADAGDLDLF